MFGHALSPRSTPQLPVALKGRRARLRFPHTVSDEQYEIYTDLATLLALTEDCDESDDEELGTG